MAVSSLFRYRAGTDKREKSQDINVFKRNNHNLLPTQEEAVQVAKDKDVIPSGSWEGSEIKKLIDGSYQITRFDKAKDRNTARKKLVLSQDTIITRLQNRVKVLEGLSNQQDEEIKATQKQLAGLALRFAKRAASLKLVEQYLQDLEKQKLLLLRHATLDNLLKVLNQHFKMNTGKAEKGSISALKKLKIYTLEDYLWEEEKGFKGQKQLVKKTLDDVLGTSRHNLALNAFIALGGENGLRDIRNAAAHLTVNTQMADEIIAETSISEKWENADVLRRTAAAITCKTSYYHPDKKKGLLFTGKDDSSGLKQLKDQINNVRITREDAEKAVNEAKELDNNLVNMKKTYAEVIRNIT